MHIFTLSWLLFEICGGSEADINDKKYWIINGRNNRREKSRKITNLRYTPFRNLEFVSLLIPSKKLGFGPHSGCETVDAMTILQLQEEKKQIFVDPNDLIL